MSVGADTRLLVFSYEFMKRAKELVDEFTKLACMKYNDEPESCLLAVFDEDTIFNAFERMFHLAVEQYRQEVEILTVEEAKERKLAMN